MSRLPLTLLTIATALAAVAAILAADPDQFAPIAASAVCQADDPAMAAFNARTYELSVPDRL